MKCDKCGKEVPNALHAFAGYGFYVEFCEGCCPRELDGSICYNHEDTNAEDSENNSARKEDCKEGS